jgi:Ca2+-binding RTX toxin-like protein
MTLSGFENLSGTGFNDNLTGDGGANLLAGDAGDDILNGGNGDDVLYGDGAVAIDFAPGTGTAGPIATFADRASGNDVLNGGKGNDILLGGGGDDVLTGDQGSDIFVFGPGSGHDHITDFEKKDVIAIDGVSGVDDFSDLTIISAGKNAVISWGTGDTITLDGYKASKLSEADFSFGATAPTARAAELSGMSHAGAAHFTGADTWIV